MLTKTPYSPPDVLHFLRFTNSARNAWKAIIEQHEIVKGKRILLPSYIGRTEREGSGVYDPVLSTRVQHSFYTLNQRLEPQFDEIKNFVVSGDYSLLLIIHYFGFCQTDMSRIRDLCDANGVILVEDCAHAFNLTNPNSNLGSIGNFCFYSLHKYYDVSSGGILRINETVQDSLKYQLEKCSSKSLERVIATDSLKVSQRRVANYRYLFNALKEVVEVSSMFQPQENNVPHNLPILVHSEKREELYFYLMQKSIPTTALYYRLIDEIKESVFPDSHFVSKNILNLPIHQGVTTDDLAFLVESIKVFFSN